MEKYVKLAISFVRHQYLPHLGLTALLIAVSGAIISFRNLDAGASAQVMEMYAVLAGILLLTPLFTPETDAQIWELKRTKVTPMWQLYLGRLLLAVPVLAVTMGIFLLRLHYGGSEFDAGSLFFAAYSEALFLGATGFFAGAVTNQPVIGYMVSLLYYMGNIGIAGKLGWLGLFPLMRNQPAHQGCFLLTAIALAVLGIWFRERSPGRMILPFWHHRGA